jgi:hypothetical protein
MGGSRSVGGKSFKSKKIKNKTGWGMGVGSITYLLEFGRVFIALAKPRRQALPASFCDNIVNHERKVFFLNTYSMLTI